MKSKSGTREHMQRFVTYAKSQFNKDIKTIRTDNGKEFCWKDFYDKHGIMHQTSCNETPQQNSTVERKHQHVLNVTRCIMFQSNLPRAFWSFAVVHVVHLINRLPSPVIQNNCPYKLLYNCVPNLSDIKVFGCLCFASTLEQNRSKLDPKARKCIFLGYKQGTKGYIVMDVHSRETFVSKNVIFYETYFYDLKERNEQVIAEETNDPMRYHCDDPE